MLHPHLSRSKKKTEAFTLLEFLIASAVFGALIGLSMNVFSSGLQSKGTEDQRLALQQNMRAALQLITQDLRTAGWLKLWNGAVCGSPKSCSNNTQISILSVDGLRTPVVTLPGATFTNITQANVCNATGFNVADLALLYNNGKQSVNSADQYTLLKISGNTVQPKTAATVCDAYSAGTPDTVQYATTPISGTWGQESYLLHAQVINYSLRPDPTDATKQVLFRGTGLNSISGSNSGTVAFNFTGLQLSYGIASAGSSALVFYNDLASAAASLTSYAATPGGTQPFIGSRVQAVRVMLTGETDKVLPETGQKAVLRLTETIDLRR